jgi:hypothetical protein
MSAAAPPTLLRYLCIARPESKNTDANKKHGKYYYNHYYDDYFSSQLTSMIDVLLSFCHFVVISHA